MNLKPLPLSIQLFMDFFLGIAVAFMLIGIAETVKNFRKK